MSGEMKGRKMSEEMKFSVMCCMFNWIQKSKSSAKKRSKFRKFLDTYCKPTDYFSAIRLILPNLDRERGSYGLKESVLATCLIDALGISKDSKDAIRLINWRKGGAKAGVNAGNFSLVATEVLQLRQGMASGGLTIKELNELLDRLASSENRADKSSILSQLINKTNAQEMKWIIQIILKDLKLGISEKIIFHEFHRDAEDLFNVTCDLKLVCEKLKDQSVRHKRQDIEVGKAVRPQLALRVSNAAAAWKKLHGKEVVVECKFDGDRIQIHKNGTDIHFFSRNFFDHPEYEQAMSKIIEQNILVDRCILDGEMLVWDTSANRFAEFGSNQEIARKGLDSDRQLCYVAFDILYDGDTSVIHQSLKERHKLLQKVVKPIKGSLEILVPNGGLNAHRPSGEPCWSAIAYSVDDVERFFKDTIENRDEGIVIKDLGSKWDPSDRSGKWMKLKPEYIRAGADLDVLIIGGYYGSGRRGGEVAQFLVGLAERSASNAHPRRFISFCRVGTGLTDEELNAIVTKLKPYFRKYEYPKKSAPSFYQVTNNSKERPDVWIESPEKSIILSITSDIRTIRSEVFAAPYALRFPRIDRVRYDKPWHECLDVQSFVELVNSGNGTTQKGGADQENTLDSKPKRAKSSRKGDAKNLSVVPSHFVQTDISNIKGESLIFSNMMFYFVNTPRTHSLESLHKIVAENGGTFSMNLNNSVTHCVASDSKGIKFKAAQLRGDVIHYSWLLDCCSQKMLLPLQPKYFISLSEATKKKLEEEIDEFSDSYYLDLDIAGLKQLLSSITRSEDSRTFEYYKNKYSPKEKWSRFHGFRIYFLNYIPPSFAEWKSLLEITIRRMKLEISNGGGKISENLFNATHLVVASLPDIDVDFDDIKNTFSAPERRILHKKKLNIVGSRWIEDCLKKKQRLPEEVYNLRPESLEIYDDHDSEHDITLDDHKSSLKNVEKRNISPRKPLVENKDESKKATKAGPSTTSAANDTKRKRGRPPSRTTPKKPRRVQRTRTQIARKPAKLTEVKSSSSSSDDDNHDYNPKEEKNNTSTQQEVDKKEIENQEKESIIEQKDYDNNNSNAVQIQATTDDPLEAMVATMIPSLGVKRKTDNDNDNNPSSSKIVQTESITENVDKEEEEPVVKKKKVSYKELANRLLGDS